MSILYSHLYTPRSLQGHHEGVAGQAGGGPGGPGHSGAGLQLLPHHSAGTGVLHEHGHLFLLNFMCINNEYL